MSVVIVLGVVVFAVVLVLLFTVPMPVRRCPRCGGDLVEWTDHGIANGFRVERTLRGCPKLRDKGADSPAGYAWWEHYARITDSKSTSDFDPYG